MKNFKFLSLLLLFTLISCGKEQFGSTPTSEGTNANGVQVYENLTCASSTLVKPPVDIVYVVDNSTSTTYIQSNIKSAIQATVNSVSSQFDYRIIGTPLISGNTSDFQILASTPSSIPSQFNDKKIISPNEFSFFMNTVPTVQEQGFLRVKNFINAHASSGLLRQQAHTLIILVSNGYDTDTTRNDGGATIYNISVGSTFANFVSDFKTFKTSLNAKQVRFMSVISHQTEATCSITAKPGMTYKEMSRLMYIDAGATDNGSYQDSYDLCNGGFSSLFTGVNSSIQQVLQPHKYNRWPITFTSNSLNTSDIKVYKVSGSTSTQLTLGSQWTLLNNSSGTSYPTRIEPTIGEPTTARNIIEFNGASNYVTYPDCVVVKGNDYTEYFGYVVINREPNLNLPVAITINGNQLSSADWTYVGYRGAAAPGFNIKVPYNGSPDTPALYRSGYMFQIKNNKFYKSGDSVEVYYQPAGI